MPAAQEAGVGSSGVEILVDNVIRFCYRNSGSYVHTTPEPALPSFQHCQLEISYILYQKWIALPTSLYLDLKKKKKWDATPEHEYWRAPSGKRKKIQNWWFHVGLLWGVVARVTDRANRKWNTWPQAVRRHHSGDITEWLLHSAGQLAMFPEGR